jgi:prevent-host-death family protein
MSDKVGVRELRQNLSRYLDRVRAGESLTVTEHGRVVARLVPAGAGPYAGLAEGFGATVPERPLEDVVAAFAPRAKPAGTTDAFLAEDRSERFPGT